MPLIESENAAWEDRYLFSHRGRWPTGSEPNDHKWEHFAVRNARFRLVGRDALYDMQADPGQTKNVIDEHRDVADAMIAAYDAWWQETRPLMVNETAPMSPTRPFHEAYYHQRTNRRHPRLVAAEAVGRE